MSRAGRLPDVALACVGGGSNAIASGERSGGAGSKTTLADLRHYVEKHRPALIDGQPCQLNADATLVGGTCRPVYDNEAVRSYAYALTGWTYPPGGASNNGCWPAPTWSTATPISARPSATWRWRPWWRKFCKDRA